MAILKPQITIPNINNPFDGTQDQDFTFNVSNSSDQVVKNTIAILDNDTQVQVYTNTVNSFLLKQTIPKNTLTNGKTYKWNIIVYNSNNIASVISDSVIFKCFPVPIPSIVNITNGIVNNQTFKVQGSYSQAQSDALQSYKYTLFTENDIELYTSPSLYDGLLSYELVNLENNTNYKVKLQVLSQGGMENNITVPFTCQFKQPIINGALQVINYPNEGAVQTNVNIIVVHGKGSNYTFEDSDWVNLTADGSNVYFSSDNGLDMKSDFTTKVWAKGIIEDVVFCTIYGFNNFEKIETQYYNNKIHVFKTNVLSGLVSHFVSGDITILPTDRVCIQLQQINGLIDVKAQKY